MADVITRFKLETTQYDSKLRDAAKGLKEITRIAELGGKGFTDFSQKALETARTLGTIASGATNTKDKLKDLVGAYNEAAKAYNNLSKEQQQSDFGKALSQSIGQLSERIKDAKQELYGLGDAMNKVKSSGSGGLFGEGGFTGMLAVTGGNLLAQGITKLGSEMIDTIQQSVELARAGEGIRIAFERLNKPGLLDNLKEATHGTVNELELMKAAVKFNDFKLPVEELGTLLAFAQQKAKDTGQSVDYMVDSIVTGLGRKSLMILDNLGLSAAQIKEKMAETGDMTTAVAAIIRDEMSKAGEYIETAADRASRAAADAHNKLMDFGRQAAPVAEQWTQTWNTIKMGALDLLNTAVTPLINALTEAGRLRTAQQERGSSGRIAQQINWLNNPGSEGRQSVYERIEGSYVSEINHARSEYNKLQKNAIWNPFAAWKADKALAALNVIKQEYEDFKKQAAPIMNPKQGGNSVVIKTEDAERNVASLTKKLKELQAERQKAIKAGDTAKSKELLQQINQVKSDIKGLNPKALTTSKSHTVSKPEQAMAKFDQAEKDYQQALDQAAMELKAGTITEADAKKKELSARESLWKSIGDAREIYDSPKLEEAQRNVENEIIYFGGIVRSAADAQKASEKAARELEASQKKLVDAENKLAEARKTGSATAIYKAQQEVDKQHLSVQQKQSVVDMKFGKMPTLPNNMKAELTVTVDDADALSKLSEIQGIQIDQKTFSVTATDADALSKLSEIQGIQIDQKTFSVTAMDADALSKLSEIQGIQIDPKTVKIIPKVETVETSAFDNLKQTIQAEIKFDKMKVDENTLRTLLQTAIQNGLDSLTVDYAGLQEKIAQGIDIPNETWQKLQDEINAELDKIGVQHINIDFKTGNIAKTGKETENSWKAAASAVQSVGSALQGLEDPGSKIAGIVGQAVANIALGFAQATAASSGGGIFAWIAAIVGGMATMMSTISAIHSATGYANGGMVKGNALARFSTGGTVQGTTYSNDQIPILANAGEVVLNAAQQSNVAQNLQENGGGKMEIVGVLTGENVVLMADRWGRRTGRGELLFGKKL